MKATIQRVSRASVAVNDAIVSSIDNGMVALIGISADDTDADVDYIARKLLNIRYDYALIPSCVFVSFSSMEEFCSCSNKHLSLSLHVCAEFGHQRYLLVIKKHGIPL